ncbi:MAG: S8 family serine peptidase [Candidatus Heimdallarchaeota archaeon]
MICDESDNLSNKQNSSIDQPHLCSSIGGNTGVSNITLQPDGTPIYDDSMVDFHNIFESHNVGCGFGEVVLVMDTPIDYRHDIFGQENFDSLSNMDCYIVDCDYDGGVATGVTPISDYLEDNFGYTDYVGDFEDNFEYYDGIFEVTDLYHGTAVAGLVKQVAPLSTIISMGVPVGLGDMLVEAHIEALKWAYDYLDSGNHIDVITISSYGDSSDPDLDYEFEAAVSDIIRNFDTLFTMSVSDVEGENLALSNLYGSMGDEMGVIGVGRIYDYGSLVGVRGSNGHNHASLPDYMDLEIMASGYSLKSALPVKDGYTNRVANSLTGNSFATPIVAGAAAVLKDFEGFNSLEVEYRLRDLAIPPEYYDPGQTEEYYLTHYGYGILNIAGALNVADTDQDGIYDREELIAGEDGYETNPFDSDTDDDTLCDGEEVLTYFTNPINDDTDYDGLIDGIEVNGIYYPNIQNANPSGYIFTNPLLDDTDYDELIDGIELFDYNSDPTDDDTDDDLLLDGEEILLGTNPNDDDSDNDLLIDGLELLNNSDPLDNDSDNDGLLDGLEVLAQYNYNTDPNNPDSDNDGYDDLTEIINGTDPNDPDDYPGSGGWGWG